MDEKAVRAQVEQLKWMLARNEAEHRYIAAALTNFEGLLRLYEGDQPPVQLALNNKPDRSAGLRVGGSAPVRFDAAVSNTVSVRTAVLKAIQDAGGEPIHAKDILNRVIAMGAAVSGKNPVNSVDFTAYSIRHQGLPVAKVEGAPRTWQWTGALPAHLNGSVPNEEHVLTPSTG